MAVILTLPAIASEAIRDQRLSVASTWQLPREPKVVCTALSPDFATLAMMHTNNDVEIWSTATRTLQRKIAAHTKPADRFFARRCCSHPTVSGWQFFPAPTAPSTSFRLPVAQTSSSSAKNAK